MATAGHANIELQIGTDDAYSFVAARSSGATTLQSMSFEAFDNDGEEIAALAKSLGSGITAAEVGDNVEGSIEFVPADTDALADQVGSYKLWIVETDGKTYVVSCGELVIKGC